MVQGFGLGVGFMVLRLLGLRFLIDVLDIPRSLESGIQTFPTYFDQVAEATLRC